MSRAHEDLRGDGTDRRSFPQGTVQLERLAAMVDHDPSLRERQPWKAAYDKDYAWVGGAIAKHYAGMDGDQHQ